EAHRFDHVDKEDAHLLALAFESATRRQDLLGEMARSVGTRVARSRRRAAAVERGPTCPAEACPFARLVLTVWTPHASDSAVKIARPSGPSTPARSGDYADSKW